MTTIGKVFAALLGVFFLFITIGGVGALFETNRIRSFPLVEGSVVEVDQGPGRDGGLSFTPIIRFSTLDGEEWEYRSSVSTSDRPDLGTVVEVRYNPDDPSEAVEDTFLALYALPIALLVFGIVGLIGVAITWIVKGRRDRRAPTDTLPFLGGGAETVSATFSHVQPRGPDDDGRFQYRVVAVRRVNGVKETYQSDWLDDDPTVRIMTTGNALQVRMHPDGTGKVIVED